MGLDNPATMLGLPPFMTNAAMTSALTQQESIGQGQKFERRRERVSECGVFDARNALSLVPGGFWIASGFISASGGVKLSIAIVALMAVGFCSALSVGFQGIEARLGGIFAQGNGNKACDVCCKCCAVVNILDQWIHQVDSGTAEQVAQIVQCSCTNPEPHDEFCKAIAGKESAFGEAYVNYRQGGPLPCEVVGIC
ncbi:hypothetical protein Ddc_10370 [Ditylenchus destructor]|nr:hypothetical protein Ddc_10370 [Ditylenchus destructor]